MVRYCKLSITICTVSIYINRVIGVAMRTTKVFKSGNSQAVRLPKDFQLNSEEVEIFKRNGEVVIREIPKNLARAFELFTQLSGDFFAEERKDLPPQEREFF